ncbi:MAG TPA: hypothetical protein VFK57_24950 [Vicinamibacterales bacterium]|nr:hypothetical protein [Vicinamibacterales bacterium]
MANFQAFIIVLVAAAAAAPAPVQQPPDTDRPVLAEFARRVNAYVEVKSAAATTVLPLVQLRDPAEIRRRTDALAAVIKSARWAAKQGDIFTPEIGYALRRAIRQGCEGDYAAQLALVREEVVGPLPALAVHARWPADVPLPLMLPGVLAALPPLPAGLQYRFMDRALVLLDIDANLIVDFLPDAIPVITTERHDAH